MQLIEFELYAYPQTVKSACKSMLEINADNNNHSFSTDDVEMFEGVRCIATGMLLTEC